MKKYLAVFDGYKFSESTMQYSIQLAKLCDAVLIGVFLDEFIYHTYGYTEVLRTVNDADARFKELDEKDKKKRDEAVQLFQKACGKAGVMYSIHQDKNIAIQDLKRESLFADLVIINKHERFTRFKEKTPTRFIKDLLAGMQCPVLVVPAIFEPVDKIVMLYDGRPSSLFAIKMFSYLLNKLKTLPVEIFTINEKDKKNSQLPENKLMRELIKRHFPKAKITVVRGNAKEEVTGYLRNHKENELVVLGAYRRNELSRWLKESMADILMKELDTPLFIAHS